MSAFKKHEKKILGLYGAAIYMQDFVINLYTNGRYEVNLCNISAFDEEHMEAFIEMLSSYYKNRGGDKDFIKIAETIIKYRESLNTEQGVDVDQNYKNYLLDCETLLQRITLEVHNEYLTDSENYEHIKKHVADFIDIREKFLDNKKKNNGPKNVINAPGAGISSAGGKPDKEVPVSNLEKIDLWSLFCQQEATKLDFVLPGLLAGSVGAIVSPGGVGKSWIASQLCLSIATGVDILGIGGINEGNVAYFNAEDPRTVMEWRMWHLMQKISHKANLLQDPSRFTCMNLLGYAPRILEIDAKRHEKWIKYIKSWSYGCRLVVIDTLRKFHQADENSSGHMTVLTQVLDEIAKETGAAVLFCHHSNKLALAEQKGDEAGASRGSSALVDNIRWQLNLVRMGKLESAEYGLENERKAYMKLCGAKANYGPETGDLWLKKGLNGIPEIVELKKKGKSSNEARNEARY